MINASISLDLRKTENIKKNLMNKVIRQSVRKNSKAIVSAVKANAAAVKRTGAMAKSIGLKVKTYKNVCVSVVGPKSKYQVISGVYSRGKKVGQSRIYRPSKIWHIVEKRKHLIKNAAASTQKTFADNVVQDIRAGIEELAP